MSVIEKLKELVKNNPNVSHVLFYFTLVLILGVLINPAVGLGVGLVLSIGKQGYFELFKEDKVNWEELIPDIVGIVVATVLML